MTVDNTKQECVAPEINYAPRKPDNYNTPIGLIGAGGITGSHLSAYRALGLNVVAIADINEENASKKRDEFYPQADIYTDHRKMLSRRDIEVVDIATHVNIRPSLVRESLEAGMHVLSQKPFVSDLDEGRELIALAESAGLKLAVNQNGRWAPHFSYMREAIAKGLIGRVNSVHIACHWDHLWIGGSPGFARMHHAILYDFSIHWFDIITCFLSGERPCKLFASAHSFEGQRYVPPSMASVIIEYANAQVCMQFHGHVTLGQEDSTIINGSKGTLRSRGTNLNNQPEMEVFLKDGAFVVPLEGSWLDYGFQGTMAELLCAIDEDREPSNSAASNLVALETCFAALRSADTGEPIAF